LPSRPPCRPLLAAGLVALLAAAPLAADPTRVVTEIVEETAIPERLRLTGSVTAPRSARLSSEVEGRIEALSVSLGERVEAGQSLLALDDRAVALDARAAAAEVDEARAEVDEARRRLDEAIRLREGNNIPRSELNARQTRVDVAEAVLERRRAARDRLELEAERHRLAAPFSGMVTARHVEIGEWASPGQALLTLVDLEALTLDFPVPLSHYARLDEARLEARLPGDDAWRELRRLAGVPREDTASRQFLLRTELAESPPLLPGTAVEGRLTLPGETHPGVPRDALMRRPDGRISLWLAVEEDEEWRAEERRVTPGASLDGRTAISEGLEAGERVVVEGNERLRDGQRLALDDG
jgi:membrane fusion protein, multidrug efflux system